MVKPLLLAFLPSLDF